MTRIDANSSVKLSFVLRYYKIRGPSRLSEAAPSPLDRLCKNAADSFDIDTI